jgi:hypothetical protein
LIFHFPTLKSTICITMSDRIIVFTRYPEAGKAKTRLIPVLGAEGAAALHQQLTEHTLIQVQQFQQQAPISVEVRFAGGDQVLMQAWLGPDLCYVSQGEGDLGDRMARSFQTAFAAGERRTLIIGTDCPDLDAKILIQAFAALEHTDLILGPAIDGGYYLIGLRRPIPELFVGIAWSTAQVRQRTIEIAEQLGLAIALLPPLSDIDTPADLQTWQASAGLKRLRTMQATAEMNSEFTCDQPARRSNLAY